MCNAMNLAMGVEKYYYLIIAESNIKLLIFHEIFLQNMHATALKW